MSKTALGRGLGALLGGNPPKQAPVPASPLDSQTSVAPTAPASPAVPGQKTVQQIAVERLVPCAFQPRKDFDEQALADLAASIREQGIIQPLVVRTKGDKFEIIAGERRWRASQQAGLREVPVIVREADDATVLELALIENLQRENLNPVEEALGFQQLISQFSLTQEQAATKVGRSRAAVANALRLLNLPPSLQTHLRQGRLSAGHAKAILGLASAQQQELACERVLRDGLSVRETELLVSRLAAAVAKPGSLPAPRRKSDASRDIHIVDLEHRLLERFGTRVALKYKAGKGALEIRFLSDDELERILGIVGVKAD